MLCPAAGLLQGFPRVVGTSTRFPTYPGGDGKFAGAVWRPELHGPLDRCFNVRTHSGRSNPVDGRADFLGVTGGIWLIQVDYSGCPRANCRVSRWDARHELHECIARTPLPCVESPICLGWSGYYRSMSEGEAMWLKSQTASKPVDNLRHSRNESVMAYLSSREPAAGQRDSRRRAMEKFAWLLRGLMRKCLEDQVRETTNVHG